MPPDRAPVVAVHGGAGDRAPEAADDEPRRVGVREAARAAHRLLAEGGSALDAVELAVRLLEDDPSFNAGTGACLTSGGEVELDASIMEGSTLRCGAVAVVRDVKNPVVLARRVMERSGHVLLAGAGASAFARSVGIARHDPALLVTPRQHERWARTKGTVGAVARDREGHLAAATSTGGILGKLPGRVGDSALVGCGTYADDALAAVSCTGEGERIIQLTLARLCAERVGRGRSATEAAREAVDELARRVGGTGGLIVVAPQGAPGFAFNTAAMSRAWSRPDGAIVAEL